MFPLDEIKAEVKKYVKEQKPREDELMRKLNECADNKKFIEFTTGKDCFDYFVSNFITKKDLRTRWRDEEMKYLMKQARKHLKKKGGA